MLRTLQLQKDEWACWSELVEFTKDKPITITTRDWKETAAASGTDGLQLIRLIKNWGEAYAQLRREL